MRPVVYTVITEAKSLVWRGSVEALAQYLEDRDYLLPELLVEGSGIRRRWCMQFVAGELAGFTLLGHEEEEAAFQIESMKRRTREPELYLRAQIWESAALLARAQMVPLRDVVSQVARLERVGYYSGAYRSACEIATHLGAMLPGEAWS